MHFLHWLFRTSFFLALFSFAGWLLFAEIRAYRMRRSWGISRAMGKGEPGGFTYKEWD